MRTIQLSFNPILVWFYQTAFLTTASQTIPAFNPILVWFYPVCSVVCCICPGSLSIPFWSDFIVWRKGSREKIEVEKCFQSHFGLILSFRFLILFPWRFQLSIPFWSDFIQMYCNIQDDPPYGFQSHFGLILSGGGRNELFRIWSFFQSHFGLILSSDPCTSYPAQQEPFNPILVWFYH